MLYGLVLLACVLVLVLSAHERGKQRQLQRTTIGCPFCAERISPAAVICPHCREDVSEPDPVSVPGHRVWVMGERRPRAKEEKASARELDRLLMLFQRERAKAVTLGGDGDALVAHIDTVIGCLTRVRIAVVEGRSIDVNLELAAILAADEQIVRGAASA